MRTHTVESASYCQDSGIDLAQKRDLIASGKSSQKVAEAIGADDVVYQTLPDMVDAILKSPDEGERKVYELEVGVFNGEYITPLSPGYLDHLERLKDKRKALANGVNKGNSDKDVTSGSHDGVENIQAQDIALHNINDFGVGSG